MAFRFRCGIILAVDSRITITEPDSGESELRESLYFIYLKVLFFYLHVSFFSI